MSKRISVLVALEGAEEGLKRAIALAARSLGELCTAAKTSDAKAAAGIAEVKAGCLKTWRWAGPGAWGWVGKGRQGV